MTILLPTQIYMQSLSTKEIKLSDAFSAAQVHYQASVSNGRDLITGSLDQLRNPTQIFRNFKQYISKKLCDKMF